MPYKGLKLESRKTYGITQTSAYSAVGGEQMTVAAVGTKAALGVIATNVHYWGEGGLG
jgi:hypothetical protein